ncbi:MAG: hypothetical protein LC725_03935, partial [Lentisphaerae bacterium]|nr:hypothetical protein [Lentisphaerota bacterium]
MKNTTTLFVKLLVVFLIIASISKSLVAGSNENKPWRSGWMAVKDHDEAVLAGAKELGFQALIIGGAPETHERLQEFAIKAQEYGVDTYFKLVPQIPEGSDKSQFEQRMPPYDEELLKKLSLNPQEWRKTYQTGGEPLEGHAEVFKKPFICFHHKEVMDATKKAMREKLTNAPALAGVGFDAFGYQNYKNCVCEESLRQLEAYRKQHPAMSAEESESAFALDSMVDCLNELADYARSVRPGIKTTIHIWPTYLPEPLYGNRLDVDYCCQSVAWFFAPYWSQSKIADYTRTVVQDEKKYFPRARGIPFIGVYLGRKFVDKPLEQFRAELRTIFSNAPSTSISIHEIADVILTPEYRKA